MQAQHAQLPKVYISLLNWNRYELTLRCLQSLQSLDYPNYQIIVVDNASSDDSVAHIRAARPDVTLLESSTNTGFAAGHALALARAQADGADLLWLLNNDTLVEPGTLDALVNAYQTHGEGLYGGVPLDEARRVLLHRKFLSPDYRERIFDLSPLLPYDTMFPDPTPREAAALSGSCLMVPLPVVREHGFMDTEYFLYAEEMDYCFRLRREGVPIWIVPEAVIWHEHGGSSAGHTLVKDIILYYRFRNQLIRIGRYGTRWDTAQAVVKDILLLPYYGIKGNGIRTIGFGARAIWDGLCGRLGKTYAPEDHVIHNNSSISLTARRTHSSN